MKDLESRIERLENRAGADAPVIVYHVLADDPQAVRRGKKSRAIAAYEVEQGHEIREADCLLVCIEHLDPFWEDRREGV